MKLEEIGKAKKILIYGYGVEGKSSEKFLRGFFESVCVEMQKSSKSPLSGRLGGKKLNIPEIFIFDENLDVMGSGNNTSLKKLPSHITSPSQASGTPLKLRGEDRQIFLRVGEFDFEDFEVIVVSAGIPRRKIPENLRNRCTSNVEIFFENLSEIQRKKIIGISGSKGKSTTCQFLNEMLKTSGFCSKIVGNFGVPFLDVFNLDITSLFCGTPLKLRGDVQHVNLENPVLDFKEDFLVAELSSYQLENLKISPHLAIFTSFFSEHLAFHKTTENYLKAKQNLWKFQKKGDRVFTQEYLAPLVDENFSYDIVDYFGENSGKQKYSEQIIYSKIISKDLFPKNSILRADHFRGNLGIVWALCEYLKIKDLETVWKKVGRNFKIIPHRLEFFEEKQDIKFYDDAIAVNTEATIAAIQFLEQDLGLIIIGGQKDSGDGFDLLLEVLRQKSPDVQIIILKSEVGEAFKKSFIKIRDSENFEDEGEYGKNFSKNLIEVESLDEAVKIAFEKTEKNKICLLSPAGKSYDKFKNFKEKGERFKALVREYK